MDMGNGDSSGVVLHHFAICTAGGTEHVFAPDKHWALSLYLELCPTKIKTLIRVFQPGGEDHRCVPFKGASYEWLVMASTDERIRASGLREGEEAISPESFRGALAKAIVVDAASLLVSNKAGEWSAEAIDEAVMGKAHPVGFIRRAGVINRAYVVEGAQQSKVDSTPVVCVPSLSTGFVRGKVVIVGYAEKTGRQVHVNLSTEEILKEVVYGIRREGKLEITGHETSQEKPLVEAVASLAGRL